MTTREQIIKIITNLPENVTTDEIMEELFFKLKVDQGLNQLNAGQSFDHITVKKKITEWKEK